jgi:DNA-damage-inducible protein J
MQYANVPVVAKIPKAEKDAFIKYTHNIGTTPSNAIRMFISAFNKRRAFPFDVSNPLGLNTETMGAIDDVKNGVGVSKPFKNIDDMFKEILD